MAGINPPFTVADAIYDCGVMDGSLFHDNMKADRMSDKLLYYELSSCMDNTYKDFYEYHTLT